MPPAGVHPWGGWQGPGVENPGGCCVCGDVALPLRMPAPATAHLVSPRGFHRRRPGPAQTRPPPRGPRPSPKKKGRTTLPAVAFGLKSNNTCCTEDTAGQAGMWGFEHAGLRFEGWNVNR